MKTPALVWANGQPMKREQLTTRVSGPTVTGVRSIITGHPAQNLSPGKLAAILRRAEQGDATSYLELAEEMEEKDLHYLAVLKKRKEAIAQLPITVVPAGEDAEAKADAELVQEFIDRDELQDEIVDMLDAIGKGWSVTEIVWEMTSDLWLPCELARSDQRFFEFDQTDGHTLRLRSEAGQLEELAAAKYIIHRMPAKSGTTVRGGLARAAAWHYMFKNYAWKDWISFLETYGMPIRLGRYDNGETEENKRVLLNALAQLGSDAAAMFPKTMEVEFVDGKGGTAPRDLWGSLIDKSDDYLSKLVLGQTNTTDAKAGGLGSGQANVHKAVEETIERSDARRLATTLNRDLIKPMIMLNRGQRKRYPKLKIGLDDPVDVAAMTAAAQILVPMGARISRKKMTEAAGLPEAEDDDDILTPPGQSQPPEDPETYDAQKRRQEPQEGQNGPQGAGGRSTRFLEPLTGPKKGDQRASKASASIQTERQPDFIDLTADEALSDWEELMPALIDPIAAKLEAAPSVEAAREILIEMLEDMDVTAIAELIARGGIAAHLQGELEVQREQEDDQG